MCNFNSSSGVMQDIDSSWQCLMLPCRENKMHVKSNWIIIVQQVRKTGYSKRGEKQHAEEKKSQNRQKKNETAKVTFSVHVNLLNVPIIRFFLLLFKITSVIHVFYLVYLYFFCQFLLGLFLCKYNRLWIMDYFLLCFFMMFLQPICHLLLSGCFIHVSSMIVCSCVDCSDPKLLYADIIPSGLVKFIWPDPELGLVSILEYVL